LLDGMGRRQLPECSVWTRPSRRQRRAPGQAGGYRAFRGGRAV